jgi:hypothetical protein
MEIFLSSSPFMSSTVRWEIQDAVIEAWGLIPGAAPFVRYWGSGDRWREGEIEAQGKFWVLADDDCLVHPKLDIQSIVNTMIRRPEYGMIGLQNVIRPYQGVADEDGIIEGHALGGVRFIRKGAVTEFPVGFDGDDSAYYDLMKARGYRQGVAIGPEFSFIHCGEWRSTWERR